MTVALEHRYLGSLLGLACGDAVGAAVEFMRRGMFEPVTGMRAGGPHRIPAGYWTDDTSMALCLADSLLHSRGFDPRDQMNRYVNWWQWGHRSSTGECFDIGTTVRNALIRYQNTDDPYAGYTARTTAGNGSLMRLAPVALYFHPDVDAMLRFSADSSRTTHGAAEAVECCVLFAALLHRALNGLEVDAVLQPMASRPEGHDPSCVPALTFSEPNVAALAAGDYRGKSRDDIVGSGYCVASLEASLWCIASTSTFEAAVLEAANLGDDADTTAAITGQLAGAIYGIDAIPAAWLDTLHQRDAIAAVARALYAAAPGAP